jgi:hypothetical protein
MYYWQWAVSTVEKYPQYALGVWIGTLLIALAL